MVTLPRFVTEVLAAHIAAFSAGEDGLLFTGREGGPIRRTAFMAPPFRPAAFRASLAPLRFHDLRHTDAALAIAAGAPEGHPPSAWVTRRSPRRSTSTAPVLRQVPVLPAFTGKAMGTVILAIYEHE
jgi:hypothetical protein